MPSLVEKAVDRLATPVKRNVVRLMASNARTRAVLNAYYRRLDYDAANLYHARYAKIFRNGNLTLDEGYWTVSFMDNLLRLPLRPEYAWLDWDSAVSIIGHDVEIKTTYANLIGSSYRPELFVDIGANYGTHSLLFAALGIPAIAFEPNPNCFNYCATACELNNLAIQWEPNAIGEQAGEIQLVFPEKDTWLGSVNNNVTEALTHKFSDLVTERVRIRPIDDYIDQMSGKRVLFKIDVEGGEVSVLRGAAKILDRIRPMIIFESNDVGLRAELYSLLCSYNYVVTALPWSATNEQRPLKEEAFRISKDTNFFAGPTDKDVTL